MAKQKEKKKFRIGPFLKGLGKPLGKVLDIAGSIVPGVAGGALDKIGELIDGEPNLTPKEKAEAHAILLMDKELEKRELELIYADKANAREMYDDSKDQADELSNHIMKWNLWGVVGMVVLNVALLLLSEKLGLSTAVIVAAANAIGMISQALLQERGQVVGFYFGSSLGSKNKDKKNEAK